jgi:hypothetical protein
MCLELWERANKDPAFISRIITGDKSWIYGYDPETKQQPSQWKSPQSPRAKKTRQVQSSMKSMLIFFQCEGGGIAVNLFLLTLRSILTFYRDVLRCLRENVRQKRPGLVRNHNRLLHQDNMPACTSLKSTEFVTNNNMVMVSHPSYSPDLSPWFCFVSQIENETEGTTFWNSVWHPKGIASNTW